MAGTTPVTLLERIQQHPNDDTWRRLYDLYTPMLRGWLVCHHIQSADADDLVQEILGVVVKRLPEFQHPGQPGAFRAWLRAILINLCRAFWRSARGRATVGGEEFAILLNQLDDPASDLTRRWNADHDRQVMQRLLEIVKPEFEPTTWRAFQRHVLEGAKTAVVALELNLTPNAVRIAKSRVLQRLREEIGYLVE